MKKYSYVGISFIVLIFGIWVVNEYMSRNASKELAYIKAKNGEKRKVPAFKMIDQNKDTISNEDYEGKVFIVEFFFCDLPYDLSYYE